MHLAIAHTESIKLLRHFSDVLIIDATYKTNWYGLPIVQVIGFDCLQINFFAIFVFISEEDKEAYTWVINVVKKPLDNDNISYPKTVLTDRDSALINAIKKVYVTMLTLMPI